MNLKFFVFLGYATIFLIFHSFPCSSILSLSCSIVDAQTFSNFLYLFLSVVWLLYLVILFFKGVEVSYMIGLFKI